MFSFFSEGVDSAVGFFYVRWLRSLFLSLDGRRARYTQCSMHFTDILYHMHQKRMLATQTPLY